MLDPNDSTLTRATHILRSAWTATLLYDGTAFDTKCMLDPKTGDFIVAIVDDALEASDITLASPRDSFDARVRIAVELSNAVSEEQRDRFTAYHLPATTPLLAIGTYEYAKLDSGEVVTPDQCPLINPLISVMGSLCRVLNSDRQRLSKLCNTLSGVKHEEPIAVGVDDSGIDIRASFGLVRLSLPEPISDPESALDVINALLESCDA